MFIIWVDDFKQEKASHVEKQMKEKNNSIKK